MGLCMSFAVGRALDSITWVHTHSSLSLLQLYWKLSVTVGGPGKLNLLVTGTRKSLRADPYCPRSFRLRINQRTQLTYRFHLNFYYSFRHPEYRRRVISYESACSMIINIWEFISETHNTQDLVMVEFFVLDYSPILIPKYYRVHFYVWVLAI